MKEINIAKTITGKRKEKGITQDELASFIGVSKAAVSKWETGQSYPDIVLLPGLAAYFNISVDELIGYEPQMANEDIRKLYEELSNDFAQKPFSEVKNHCREIAGKYFSCFPLLFQIGVLYLNYGWTSKDDEQKIATIVEAKELFVRVKELSDDIELKQYALSGEATCAIMLGNPNEVIFLLEDFKSAVNSNDVMLSQAYIMTGKIKEAKTKLQGGIYKSLVELFSTIPPYLAICADDLSHAAEIYRRAVEIIELFNLKTICPTHIMPFYLAAAQLYSGNGNSAMALEVLETYTELVTGDIYPLKLFQKDGFFNLIDGFEGAPAFALAALPRDENSIKQSMADAVIENPAFSILAGEPRFRSIAEKLNNNIV